MDKENMDMTAYGERREGFWRTGLTVVMLCLCVGGWAQGTTGDVEAYLKAAGDHAALFRGRMLTSNKVSGWQTLPYWGDGSDFRHGQVCYGGVLYSDVELKYDIYRNELEVLSPMGRHVVIPDAKGVDYFVMDGLRFVPRDGWFVAQLFQGKAVSLELRREKRKVPDMIINNEAFRNLEATERLELHYRDQSTEVRRLKDVQRMFPEYQKKLKAFSSQQRLTYGQGQRQASMLALAAWLDKRLDGQPEPSVWKDVEKGQTDGLTGNALRDSLFEGHEWETRMPAYEAFREHSTVTVEFEPEPDEVAGVAGVSDLKPLTEERLLGEVEVIAFHSKLSGAQTGVETFRPQQLRNMPMAMGESDVMKLALSLPGVSSQGEASSGLNIRGGSADQNLTMIGPNTVYNPMHLFGLFSAFNTDFISNISLYKSGIPAQYGGHTSAVMAMTPHQANKKQWQGSASVGLVTSKAALDIPIVRNKLSLGLTGRTTYSDWMLKVIPEDSGYRNGRAGFYDMNGVLSWSVNRKQDVNLYGYFSHDRFAFTLDDDQAYTNANASAEWKGYWNDDLKTTVQAGWDRYGSEREDRKYEYMATRLAHQVEQYFLRGMMEMRMGDRHQLKAGWNALEYVVQPGRALPVGVNSAIRPDSLPMQRSLEVSLHAEDEWKPTDRWTLSAGLRATLYQAMEKDKEHTYVHPELRLAGSYSLGRNQRLKASLNTLHQYVQKLSNTVIMSPTDTWTLSNAAIRPQRSWQVAGGYYWQQEDRKFEASAEVYYKRLKNYLTYGNAAQLTMNHELEKDVFGADGQAFGLEIQLKKPTGRINGWISYTFSRSMLRQPKGTGTLPINGGRWFNSDVDRPHELNFVGNLRFTRRYSMSVNMDYSTGRPTTLPSGGYYDQDLHRYLPLYTDRNTYRIPSYFRTDVSFNFEPSHHLTARTHSWLTVGCYNVTGRRNAYSVYYEHMQSYRLSIFGAPIPFVAYNIKF